MHLFHPTYDNYYSLGMINNFNNKDSMVNVKQKDILINRMSLSEFNGINLSEIILQDVSNTTRLLENEIQLYIDDLTLSHINSSLLNRFKMEL